jgi:hypothetical protein
MRENSTLTSEVTKIGETCAEIDENAPIDAGREL